MPSAISCPHCGAPLNPTHVAQAVGCAYCGHHVILDFDAVSSAAFSAALDRYRSAGPPERCVTVSGQRYEVQGRIAVGARADVFLARDTRRLTQRVVLKVQHASLPADVLVGEWLTLELLQQRAGASLLGSLLPSAVARGVARDPLGWERPTSVFRHRSGFTHSCAQLLIAFPTGLDARHVSWIARRALEQLAQLHSLGFVHGAVEATHLLVHPRDHGVRLVGWSAAGESASLDARAADVAGVARLALQLGRGGAATSVLPQPLLDVLSAATEARFAARGAEWLRAQLREATTSALGAPRFIPLSVPS